MKKAIFGLVAIGAMIAGPVMAADMPVKAPPIPYAAEFNWTGWYVGGNLGGSWAHDPENFDIPAFGFNISNNATSSSVIGGAQIGYNYQINHIVLGAEADLDWRHNSNIFSCPLLAPTGCVPAGASVSILTLNDDAQKWLGTFRGRLGVAFNRVFFYGTGGLAYGNVQHTLNETQLTAPGGTPLASLIVSDSTNKTGWAAGVGAEYAINNQWSIGVEYLHIDLGSTTLSTPNPAVVINTVTFNPSSATFTDRSNIVRARLDYRFNLGSAVAPPLLTK